MSSSYCPLNLFIKAISEPHKICITVILLLLKFDAMTYNCPYHDKSWCLTVASVDWPPGEIRGCINRTNQACPEWHTHTHHTLTHSHTHTHTHQHSLALSTHTTSTALTHTHTTLSRTHTHTHTHHTHTTHTHTHTLSHTRTHTHTTHTHTLSLSLSPLSLSHTPERDCKWACRR